MRVPSEILYRKTNRILFYIFLLRWNWGKFFKIIIWMTEPAKWKVRFPALCETWKKRLTHPIVINPLSGEVQGLGKVYGLFPDASS